MSQKSINIPNLLSGFRLIAAPFLLYIAWTGHALSFLILLAIMLLSDAVDGYIARSRNIATEFGTKLDSWGDMATYLIVPICAWWLWPDIIKREAIFVVIGVGSFGVPLVTGFIKYKQLPSYHTWSAKAAAVMMSMAIFLLFAFDFPLPFRFCVVFQVLVAFESVAITLKLSEWQCNVPSYWHASGFFKKQTKASENDNT